MKNKTQKYHIKPFDLLISILVSTVIVGIIYVWFQRAPSPNTTPENSQSNSNLYNSAQMEMSAYVASNMEIIENSNTITIKNSKGNIIISKIGTTFENAQDHFDVLAERNTFTGYTTTKTDINTYDGIVVEFVNGTHKEKAYYFYVDNVVYSMRASSPSLFEELDFIAKSFQYVPSNK